MRGVGAFSTLVSRDRGGSHSVALLQEKHDTEYCRMVRVIRGGFDRGRDGASGVGGKLRQRAAGSIA